MRSFWKNLVKITLITSLLAGCAGIPGKNVELENYPDIEAKSLKNINLQYDYNETHAGLTSDAYGDYYNYFQKTASDKSRYPLRETYDGYLRSRYWSEGNYELISKADKVLEVFNDKVIFSLKSKNSSIGKFDKKNQSGCVVRFSTKSEIKENGLYEPYFAITFFTVFIIPFYRQDNFEAKAFLVSYPSESYLKDKAINILPDQINLNKTQIKQSKNKNKGVVTATNYLITQSGQKINEGDYFLDENNRLTKLLKTYELKDKVHEVWSSLWMLSWFVVNPNKYAPNAEHPKDAKKIMEDKISEALTRSIINDASQFKECQKDQPSSSNKK